MDLYLSGMIRLRHLFIISAIWLAAAPTLAQSKARPARVTDNGNLPDSFWRFKAGDSLVWASPAYNDDHWAKGVAPANPMRLNEPLWSGGKGWFRIRFRLSKRKQLDTNSLVVSQLGHSDVYLDGRLLATIGLSPQNRAGAQRVIRFLPLPVTDTNQHLLAVRYAFRHDPVVTADFDAAAFKMTIERADDGPISLVALESVKAGVSFLLAGIFGCLALLHFLFYRTNKTQSVNKLLGWEMVAFAISFGSRRFNDFVATLTAKSLLDVLSTFTLLAGLLLLLTAIYQYLNLRRGRFYYGVISLMSTSFLYELVAGPIPYRLDLVCFALLLAEYIRISWIGRRRNDADSRLPWVSLRTSLYCVLAFILTALLLSVVVAVSTAKGAEASVQLGWFSGVIFLITLLGLISFPVGLSLSLVRDYARTYQSLGDKLREVEELSVRAVTQEQEKQQLLARQNETLEHLVTERTAALDQSLTELRATQDQLIQREKLASLGELTAGVAHEIQNPLNFVNNFSDVSVELLTELEQEQGRPAAERDTGLEKEILGDIKENISKISHHGQRAAGIVRGMLQHSRASVGQREPTDLNALTEEYLRLAYHGLRRSGVPAKEKTFEVDLATHFDPDLPTVSIVPQDIGRVLMNLFTNAFYAVQERSRHYAAQPDTYRPTVTVRTQLVGNTVELRVHDNGIGIADEVRSKIFQPFFTTKPTGKGIGLGLSLSYDIITKGHGGTISLQSEPAVFTEFVVALPLN